MFDRLPQLPLDPIFQLLADFQADERPGKVNLGIGVYKDQTGNPVVFPSIQLAFAEVDSTNFNYQPIRGNAEFLERVAQLLLPERNSEQWALQATCGGTQACRVFADLMAKTEPDPTVLLATPTWGNHFAVFSPLMIRTHEHLTPQGNLNVSGYLEAIKTADRGSVLVLHGGEMHNPTGLGFHANQLDQILPVIQDRGLMVFVDMAYAGFGDGFLPDIEFIQKLDRELDDLAVGFSFSKCASLYEHRTGVLMVKTAQKKVVESQLGQLMRENVSMAPGIGQEVMLTVLEKYQQQWLAELENARLDIESRKAKLIRELPEMYSGLDQTKGMFATLPLDQQQITDLKQYYAVYMPNNARINFGSLELDQIKGVAEALGSFE